MKFENTLIKALFLRRYKRFFVDVKMNSGEVVTVYCPNTGTMQSCMEENAPVLLSESHDPKRKLKLTLEMVFIGNTWININSLSANKLVEEYLIENEKIQKEQLRKEVKFGQKSRLDFSVLENGILRYIEVKSVTLKNKSYAEFPDTETIRGQRHLHELIDIVKSGARASLYFVIQREDVAKFTPSKEHDPKYARYCKEALEAGVEFKALQVKLTPEEIKITGEIPCEI